MGMVSTSGLPNGLSPRIQSERSTYLRCKILERGAAGALHADVEGRADRKSCRVALPAAWEIVDADMWAKRSCVTGCLVRVDEDQR